MSSIEGKPISTFTFGFEVSANAVTSITRYQEEQTMVKTLDKFLSCLATQSAHVGFESDGRVLTDAKL